MSNKIVIVGIVGLMLASMGTATLAEEESAGSREMYWLKSRIAELEAKLGQVERRQKEQSPDHDHRGAGFSLDIGHDHAHLDIHDIHVHGGLDWRYVDVQGSTNKMFLHEAEIGVGARLEDWLDTLISFTKHYGEEVEIEQAYGKFLFKEQHVQVKVGQFFVNFGPENRAGFFERRTVTPSAMRAGFFGHENWTDTGIEISSRFPVGVGSIVSAAILDGNNAKTFGDGSDTVDNNAKVAAFNVHNALATEWGTVTFGASYAHGKWDEDSRYAAQLVGLDGAWKRGNFDILGEYMYRTKDSAGGDINGSGFYLLGAYTWPLAWQYLNEIEVLFAYGQSDPTKTTKERRYSPQLTFGLTETAKISLIYDIRKERPSDTDNNRFIAQFAYHF